MKPLHWTTAAKKKKPDAKFIEKKIDLTAGQRTGCHRPSVLKERTNMIAELSPKFGVRQNDVPPVVLLANPDAVRAAVDAATPAANMPNVKYVSLADFLLATTYCDAPATVAPDQTLWTAVIHHRFPFAAEPLSFA